MQLVMKLCIQQVTILDLQSLILKGPVNVICLPLCWPEYSLALFSTNHPNLILTTGITVWCQLYVQLIFRCSNIG